MQSSKLQFSKREGWMRATGLAIAMSVGVAAPALADEPTNELKTGASCVLANVVYMPAKLLYAAGGGLVAGAAYLFSAGDKDVAKPILDAAVGGDYVVQPDHLKGDKQLSFFGQSQEQQAAEAQALGDVSAPSPASASAAAEPGF
jgi:hypothetical protein